MQNIIEDLEWRYATKKFDPTKKVSTEDLETIKEAIRLSASSYGLQPLKFLIIEDPEVRQRLRAASYGQPQITDASHVIVLCSDTDTSEDHIDAYMDRIVETRNVPKEGIQDFGNYIKQAISPMSMDDKATWNSKQAYIVLGHLLHTCASLRIDSTPMEGFDPKAYDEILGLSAKQLRATLVCTIGYRHEEDQSQYMKKVRKSKEELFETI